ncbi:hypothetical protein ACLB2K_062039 [Fragaria x ananassa]
MDQEKEQRSYWRRWSKQDFFPEPTFINFTSCKQALSNTPSRLKNRFLNRSTDSYELLQLPKQSENTMKRCLNWWDLVWLSFGSVVGSGIFVITGEATLQAGPAIVLSYAISGLSALLSDSLPDGFNLLNPVAVVVILVANGIAMSGTSTTSILNWITSIASVAVIVFIIAVGFSHCKTSNLKPFFPYGAEGVFKASALVYWSYTGFDLVATMPEEVKRPSKDIPRYTQISANVAYSAAFQAIGMNWAKYLVSICALKGMTTSLLVCSLGQASTLAIFIFVAIALVVRRYYVRDVTPTNDLAKFHASLFVIVGSSIGIAVLWNSNVPGWIWYVIATSIWIFGTLWTALLPKQRVARVWGVPLVPLLPAVSSGISVFLIGSLGYLAFLRFAICTAVMVVYYLLVGVHAPYDVAHQIDQQESRIEDGNAISLGLSLFRNKPRQSLSLFRSKFRVVVRMDDDDISISLELEELRIFVHIFS